MNEDNEEKRRWQDEDERKEKVEKEERAYAIHL